MLTISKHRTILNEIIKDIYSDTLLGPILGFKGGTAMYILYNLPRFSVDLDFDLLDFSKKEDVFVRIGKILERYGNIKEKADKKYTLFYLMSYEKGQRSLKVEISKRNLGNRYELKNHLGTPVKVMVPQDMAANKFTALLGRKKLANRDIFDIWFMLKNHWDINLELLEKRTGLKANDYFKNCIDFLEKGLDVNIKKNLIQETIFLLKLRLIGGL